jgi:hypothetical protein
MTPEELQGRLERLGAEWPVPSVAEAVLARIDSPPAPRPVRPVVTRRRTAVFAAAVLAASAAAAWLLFLANPPTLHAQVRRALEKARSAHVVISGLDANGVRQRAEIWYERGRGFRAESPDDIILDDGRQQWTWRPGAKEGELVIARRPSRDAAEMITDLFQLGNAPAAWGRQRAPEHDRAFGGRPCRGFVVTPPTPEVVAADPNPPRFVVLVDADERVVHLEEQRRANGQWQAGREVSLAYDVDIPAEKLAVNLPTGGRVIDAERAFEDRFPLDRALARAEADGLLFAVHELRRGEDDAFYVVSSVRGTPAYLKDHPPRRRRLNLQTTLLDVADQGAAASVDQDCHRAVLASAESDGVHYLWWLAVRRRFFTVEQGKHIPFSESPSLEVRPGTVRVPLQAIHRIPETVQDWVRVPVEVSVPGDPQAVPLAEIAVRARRDGLLLGQAPGAVVSLYGWVRAGVMRPVAPEQITDADYARQLGQQLEWLRSHDEVSEPGRGMAPPGLPGARDGR